MLLGERDRHHADVAELLEQLGRKHAIAIEFFGDRRHFSFSEIADERLQLFLIGGQIEVHVGISSLRAAGLRDDL